MPGSLIAERGSVAGEFWGGSSARSPAPSPAVGSSGLLPASASWLCWSPETVRVVVFDSPAGETSMEQGTEL